MACDHGHTHLIVFTHACSYYLRVATISFAELHVRLLFRSNKYGRYKELYVKLGRKRGGREEERNREKDLGGAGTHFI